MLSVPHLIIIFVVALVVFGPEKLPELARNLGKVMAEFRRTTGDLRSTFEEHMRDLEREADEHRIVTSKLPPANEIGSGTRATVNTPANVVPALPPSARAAEPLRPDSSEAPAGRPGAAEPSNGSSPADPGKSETLSDGHPSA
jgi:sec-independent protein translocase protein TatB